jgi:glutamate-1-semialdehyde 2,1-aminomutase
MNQLAPDGPVYQAGTLSGNPLALICGWATLEIMQKNDAWTELNKKTTAFVKELQNQVSGLPVKIVSIGSIFWICLQENTPSRAEDIDSSCADKYAQIFNRALEAGIYLAPSAYEVGFVSTSHTTNDLHDATELLGGIIKESV